ncbi:Uroporphyrinogen-III synthase [Alteripontixanthobacter maritimus]|uniref:Uroporphyrinogen-III synthase n=1 Tax=Alteripontixanthobacter maritimus TaxID=2161824 RepID=A0A369Q8K2_9SPHN|nr:uroporphyrinogen-III synthase [Alteripontixanthobacter maritimus]RDC59486.1 Uroporphyrinogen-III synthase [Alteripontixanthobacter maritimus]
MRQTQPVLCIRPEPGLTATRRNAAKAGIEVKGQPMFAIRSVSWDPPEGRFDAILAGSANVFRKGGPGLALYKDLPVHAVGQTTAELARQHGFTVASIGRGGLQSVLDALGGGVLHLLRLCGRDRVELSVHEAVSVTDRAVYESAPLPMPAEMGAILRDGGVVLLHSAAAARHFAEQIDRLRIHRGNIALVALAPAIAVAAGNGWRAVLVAETPDDTALLALAAQLCHD